MSENKKDNFKYALCYVLFVPIIMYFIEENKSKELSKHINYWIILFVWLIIINIVLNSVFMWFLTVFTTLWYVGISIYLWFKAYAWEDVEMEILDNIEKKVQSKFNDDDKKDVLNNKDL